MTQQRGRSPAPGGAARRASSATTPGAGGEQRARSRPSPRAGGPAWRRARRASAPWTTARPCGRPGRAGSGSTAGRAAARRRRRAAPCAAAAGARAGARAPEQHEPAPPGRRAEEERPVVGVEHRREGDGEADRRRAAHRAVRRRVGARRRAASRSGATSPSRTMSAYMRASCAYCVMNGFTAARSAAIQAVRVPNSSRPPHHATGTQSTANSRESAWAAASRAARQRQPQVEQQVVERRRAVLAQHAGDVAQRPVGDAHREALVDPEAHVELARAQQDGEREQHAEPERDGEPRAAERPRPQLPRRPCGVGGHAPQVRASRRGSCA